MHSNKIKSTKLNNLFREIFLYRFSSFSFFNERQQVILCDFSAHHIHTLEILWESDARMKKVHIPNNITFFELHIITNKNKQKKRGDEEKPEHVVINRALEYTYMTE